MTEQSDAPSNGSSKKLIGLIVVIIVIVAAVAGILFLTQGDSNSPSPTPTVTPTPSATQAPSPTPTPTETANVSVLSVSHYSTDASSFDIVGEVQNNLGTNIKNVEVIVTFYDTNGNFLAVDSTTTEIEILKPNQKSPFKLTGYLAQDLAGYGVSVHYTETQDQPFNGLTIASQMASVDPEGLHNIVGTVKNTGGKEATHVMVVGTYYDSAGTVIGISFSYADPTVIKAGATASFALTSYPVAMNPASYEVQVQGR